MRSPEGLTEPEVFHLSNPYRFHIFQAAGPAKLPACMRGTELRGQDRRTAAGLLPTVPFRDRRIIARRSACWRLLPGAGIPQRPFARPQRLSVSRPPLRGQSSRPATSTPCPAARRDRSTRDSPAPTGLHPARSGSRPLARIPSRGPALPSPHRISTPLRGFHPIRLKAFNPTRSRKAHLPDRPDHPSLPAPALFL
jgi:hypothetical protein